MTKIKDLNLEDTEILFEELKTLVQNSKNNLVSDINLIIATNYWNIGYTLYNKVIKSSDNNDKVSTIKKLSAKLTLRYGDGFDEKNLMKTIKFYRIFKNKKDANNMSKHFSWSHIVQFIKIEDEMKRNFYIAVSRDESWSVRTLKKEVNSMLFERTTISQTPEKIIINEVNSLSDKDRMTTSMYLKDPYFLDFLELKYDFSEKKIKPLVLKELESFILEIGSDFSFISRQKRILVNEVNHKIDLLFFHRKLRSLVLIEIKVEEFKAEDKEDILLYLDWLNKHEKYDYENDPIAIILCLNENSQTVKIIDLKDDKSKEIEYWSKLPPEEILKDKLYKAIEYAKNRIVSRGINTRKKEKNRL